MSILCWLSYSSDSQVPDPKESSPSGQDTADSLSPDMIYLWQRPRGAVSFLDVLLPQDFIVIKSCLHLSLPCSRKYTAYHSSSERNDIRNYPLLHSFFNERINQLIWLTFLSVPPQLTQGTHQVHTWLLNFYVLTVFSLHFLNSLYFLPMKDCRTLEWI